MATQIKHRNGLIGAVAFHGLLLILLLSMAYRTPLPLPAEQGILVDFGNSDFGFGNFEPRMSDVAQQRLQQTASTARSEQQTPLTQDFEESAALPERTVSRQTTETTVSQTPTETPREATPVEQVRTEERSADPRAMFPGRGDASSTATSQGAAGGQGNQGVPTGAPNVHVYGEGINVGGGLENRGVAGSLPRPAYNIQEQGVVVVAITVNSEGTVTRATAGARGTTTLNETLRSAAERAARQTRFNRNPNAIEQTGTITYVFKLQGE